MIGCRRVINWSVGESSTTLLRVSVFFVMLSRKMLITLWFIAQCLEEFGSWFIIGLIYMTLQKKLVIMMTLVVFLKVQAGLKGKASCFREDVIWLTTVGCIWNSRNGIIFNNRKDDIT